MAVEKTINIDGVEVKFKASASIPRMYRNKFGRDIFKDLSSIKKDDGGNYNVESLELFENVAYIMAKHADPENVPDSVEDFFEQFGTFSIYQIFPQLLELWSLNNNTKSIAKKN